MFRRAKHGICLALVMSIFLMGIGAPMALGATFKEDTVIELEGAALASNFSVANDKNASGGKYIIDNVSGTTKLEDPDGKKPEVLAEFEVSKDAKYFVWVRFSCLSTGSDSMFIGFNQDKINSQYGVSADVTGEGVWGWKMMLSGDLKAGKNTLKIYHREAGLKLDAVYVTANASYKPEGAVTATPKPSTSATPTPSAVASGATPAPVKPIGTQNDMTDGSVLIEAESTASSASNKFTVVADEAASGEKSILVAKVGSRVDDPVGYGLPLATYSFKVDQTGTFSAWIRALAPSGGADTLWSNFDNKPYKQANLMVSETEWSWVKVFADKLEPGVHTFNIVPREAGMKIDRILITIKGGYSPSGVGELPGKGSPIGAVVYPTPSVLPPAGHPRVYFTKDDIPKILENAKKPQNASAWAKHESNLLDTAIDTILPLAGSATNNFNAKVLGVIESRAFDYAIRGNEEMGKKAVKAMRGYVAAAAGGDYNMLGQTVFTVGEVYDWCYALLTDEDKEVFADAVINYASQMEIGWPPTKQGAVTGHGVEGQLQRDLMCAGIAMYDERPDIYLNVAGRFFSEFVPAKKYLYQSHMNMQGDHYTGYRAQWEILGTLTMDAIGVPNVYGPDQKNEMYWAMYARRPDGQVLRDGDGSKNNATLGSYSTSFRRSMLHYGNYFNDPYLKWEAAREWPFFTAMEASGNQSTNCVEFLIFNNSDLGGRPASELPLTKYFPEPKGGMIARTGWEDGFDSPAVVAEMKINEYWTANHQHLDAGAFQIYYKGALANDTGYYQAGLRSGTSNSANDGNSDYGSLHFKNYYRRTIAHNAMLVYDPNEPTTNFGGGVNDGGQKMPNNGSETNKIEQLLDPKNGYKVGEVLGQEFGEDPTAPNYTYLKGDLTKAYSEKVTGYERSFMFLNLKNKEHPAAILVFDRVAASNETFKKSWLLHGLQEPIINGNQTIFKDTRAGYNGKLTVDTLLPKADNLTITPVGGPDKEFWVNDGNYFAIPTKDGVNEGSGWRVEISPKTPSKTDYFLNVLQVGDANPDMPSLPVTTIETDTLAGAVVADRVVVFGKEKARIKDDVAFEFAGDGEFEITVADLEKGTWQVTKDGTALTQASATDEGGVVVFKGSAGAYKLTYLNDKVNRPVIEVWAPTHEGIGVRVGNRLIYMDVPPTIQNDRTLVPMRAIFEKLGVSVSYDDATATATAVKDGREVKITQDSKTATIDGQSVELDVPATVLNGRFLVPVRFVSEAFYAKVEWDDFAKIVNITPGSKGGASSGNSGIYPPLMKVPNALGVVGTDQSASEEGNTIANSLDGDLNTRWAVEGSEQFAWGIYDLGEVKSLDAVHLAFYNGNSRIYTFSIDVSEDGVNYKRVLDKQMTSGKTNELEAYPLNGMKARYVKYLGGGNSVNQWNSLTEIAFSEKK